jgi:hypothetical protein
MTNTTLLFAGTDLRSLTGIVVQDLSGIFAPNTRRGQHDVIPGSDGWRGAALPIDGYNFDVPVVVEGDTHAAMFANLTALATALEGSGGLGQLERRIDDGAGGYVAHFAAGACAGLNPTLLDLETGQLTVTFANLDGRWHTAAGAFVPI